MKEAWEIARDDAGVSLKTARRDGFVILSGAIAGVMASVFELYFHGVAGILLGRGPFAFFRSFAAPFASGPIGSEMRDYLLLGVVGLVLLAAGAALGIIFALIADRLRERNDILWAGLAYGLGLFALAIIFRQSFRIALTLPSWEILGSNLVFGLALMVQQAVMDLLEPYVRKKPVRLEDQGPIRMPTLGPSAR
jgi:hypothetical protein